MTSIIEFLSDRSIGTVEYVAADMISVLLHAEAPQATALNTGSPLSFPRINSYVLIPNEAGATVGLVVSIRIERSPFPKRKGTVADFGLVDLPFPSRVMTIVPIGTLVARSNSKGHEHVFRVRRGVDVFPSVGDPVAVPTSRQLRAIVEGEGRIEEVNDASEGRIRIGASPLSPGASVYVDPNKLFGRHLAVLGNTGSGKSCSVAGLVRWSLEAAREARIGKDTGRPNARFIVLDVNGEYANTFTDLGARKFSVDPVSEDVHQLQVPAWFWNGEEWAAFVGAAPGVQRPVLLEALRRLRGGGSADASFRTRMQTFAATRATLLRSYRGNAKNYATFPGTKNTWNLLLSFSADCAKAGSSSECKDASHQEALADCASTLERIANSRYSKERNGYENWYPYMDDELADAERSLSRLREAFGGQDDVLSVSENDPIRFDVREVSEMVGVLAGENPSRDISQFVDTLRLRIQSLFANDRLSAVANPDAPLELQQWLGTYIGEPEARNGCVSVLDLSLVPSEVVHIVVAVLARTVFEAVQRYRRDSGNDLPTVLVLEEAHTFINRDAHHEGSPPASRLCCRVLERIAREGRKFGVGLVISSQRPAELSETILAQCNTFLLHRIVNDRDQELVRKLVPDGLGAALRELPNLPSRRAVLLGSATPAPLLVEMSDLPKEHRPHSPDPAFWEVWTGDAERGTREFDWSRLARQWLRSSDPTDDG